jgi:hypothetical protein
MTAEQLNSLPNKYWQNFFKKFDEIDTLKINHWKEVHLLAYICRKYEQLYNVKFAITIKGTPTKCTEMFQTKSILGMLGTTNMLIARDYVDWVFANKVSDKKRFFKIGYFLNSGFVNEFFFARQKKEQITRSTIIPQQYKEIAEQLGIVVETYGDLAFLQMAVESRNDKGPNYIFLANLEAVGLNLNSLKELK